MIKHKLFLLIILLVILFSACKNNKIKAPVLPADTSKDTTTFYDLNSFFTTEIKEVSSTPYFIYSILTKDEKRKDSVVLSSNSFAQIAKEFQEEDITKKDIKPYYKENIFRDLSTKSVTFSYSTSNKELEVQNIDILLDEETNKVKFVFIRANKTSGDSTVITQLNWKQGKNFLINKSVLKEDGSRYSTQQYVSWNE